MKSGCPGDEGVEGSVAAGGKAAWGLTYKGPWVLGAVLPPALSLDQVPPADGGSLPHGQRPRQVWGRQASYRI